MQQTDPSTSSIVLRTKRDRRDFPTRDALTDRVRAALSPSTPGLTLAGFASALGIPQDVCRRILASLLRRPEPARASSPQTTRRAHGVQLRRGFATPVRRHAAS